MATELIINYTDIPIGINLEYNNKDITVSVRNSDYAFKIMRTHKNTQYYIYCKVLNFDYRRMYAIKNAFELLYPKLLDELDSLNKNIPLYFNRKYTQTKILRYKEFINKFTLNDVLSIFGFYINYHYPKLMYVNEFDTNMLVLDELKCYASHPYICLKNEYLTEFIKFNDRVNIDDYLMTIPAETKFKPEWIIAVKDASVIIDPIVELTLDDISKGKGVGINPRFIKIKY